MAPCDPLVMPALFYFWVAELHVTSCIPVHHLSTGRRMYRQAVVSSSDGTLLTSRHCVQQNSQLAASLSSSRGGAQIQSVRVTIVTATLYSVSTLSVVLTEI